MQTEKVQVQQTKIKGAEDEAARLARERDAADDKLSKLAAELEGGFLPHAFSSQPGSEIPHPAAFPLAPSSPWTKHVAKTNSQHPVPILCLCLPPLLAQQIPSFVSVCLRTQFLDT